MLELAGARDEPPADGIFADGDRLRVGFVDATRCLVLSTVPRSL